LYDFSRWSRDTEKGLASIRAIQQAGGDLWSCQERIDTTTPDGWFMLTSFLANATLQRAMAGRRFRAAATGAVSRGAYMAGTIPLGYVRDGNPESPTYRKLVPDPATRDIVLGTFERRAKGLSWVKLAAWLTEQGHPRTESGAKALIHNPAYLGVARYGDAEKKDAHEAIVPRGLWRRANEPGRKSARDGRLTGRFLLQGLALCGSCGRAMYLSGGKRHGKDYEHYVCRQPRCSDHAYARARALDDFVLNAIEEVLTGLNPDGERVGPGDHERWRAASFVPTPGGDDAEVAEAEAAPGRPGRLPSRHDPAPAARRGQVQRARVRLRGRGERGRVRPGRGPGAERGLVGAGRPPLEHRVGPRRAQGVAGAGRARGRRLEGPRAAEPPRRCRAAGKGLPKPVSGESRLRR
jgi:hypothetical protein